MGQSPGTLIDRTKPCSQLRPEAQPFSVTLNTFEGQDNGAAAAAAVKSLEGALAMSMTNANLNYKSKT
jgi:hypothetical protein